MSMHTWAINVLTRGTRIYQERRERGREEEGRNLFKKERKWQGEKHAVAFSLWAPEGCLCSCTCGDEIPLGRHAQTLCSSVYGADCCAFWLKRKNKCSVIKAHCFLLSAKKRCVFPCLQPESATQAHAHLSLGSSLHCTWGKPWILVLLQPWGEQQRSLHWRLPGQRFPWWPLCAWFFLTLCSATVPFDANITQY